MLKRFAVPVLVAAVGFLGSPGRSQVQDDPAQQQALEQFQQMAAQAQQNLQQQGIDPQQFGQQIMQQMQNGTLDPAALQQQLIDNGIVSQQMIQQMQGSVQTLALAAIRRQLASPDDEWALLQPKLQRILLALADVGQSNRATALRSVMGGQTGSTPVAMAAKELQAALDDPNTTPEQLVRKLNTWRVAHEAAKLELGAARDDMRNLLTLRQEAILLSMGVLD